MTEGRVSRRRNPTIIPYNSQCSTSDYATLIRPTQNSLTTPPVILDIFNRGSRVFAFPLSLSVILDACPRRLSPT